MFLSFKPFIKSYETYKVVYFKIHEFFLWHTIVSVRRTHFFKQKFYRWGYFVLLRKTKRYCIHFSNELFFWFRLPRSNSNHHFIKDHPYWKDVTLWWITVPKQRLQRHIKGSSYVLPRFDLVFGRDSKAKISYFPILRSFENVGWLDISMNDSHLKEILSGIYNLRDNGCGFLLRQLSVLRNVL